MFPHIKTNAFIKFKLMFGLSLLSLSCSNEDFDAISTIERREVPVVQVEAEIDASRIGDVSVAPVLPSESVNAEDSGDDSLFVQRFNLLQGNYNNSARAACKFAADKTLIGSQVSFEAQGGYIITQIEELEVVNDFRKTFPLPGEGEKVVVLQCNSLSRFNVDGVIYEGRMMIFLLVDDLGQNRARWEPDLTTVKKVG